MCAQHDMYTSKRICRMRERATGVHRQLDRPFHRRPISALLSFVAMVRGMLFWSSGSDEDGEIRCNGAALSSLPTGCNTRRADVVWGSNGS